MNKLFKAIASILVVLLIIALLLPFTVKAYSGELSNAALTTNGGWREQAGEAESESLYMGYVKTGTRVYTTVDGNFGKLFLVGVDLPLTQPSLDSLKERVTDTVKERAKGTGVDIRTGPTESDLKVDGNEARQLRWTAKVANTNGFFKVIGQNVIIIATFWNGDDASLIAVGYILKNWPSGENNLKGLIQEVKITEF